MKTKIWVWYCLFWLLPLVTFAQIEANFTVNNAEGCDFLQASFFDQSVSPGATIVDWQWDLAGTFSAVQNPGIIFNQPGLYTICLTVTDNQGNSDQTCKTDYIKVYSSPEADFDIDIQEGCSPLEVTFTNTSISSNGDIEYLLWDVGGSRNVVSTGNPNKKIISTYTAGGSYSTSLTVRDEKGCTDTKSVTDLIDVYQLLPPLISTEIISFCDLPWEVSIRNEDVDDDAQYFWDFGNGQTYNGAQPPRQFFDAGSYDLTLIVQKEECSDTTRLEDFINTGQASTFVLDNDVVCQNTAVSFIDSSLIAADSVVWDFGDGTTSQESNPSHVFGTSGCQTIELIRYIGDCVDTVKMACLDVLAEPAVTYEIDNSFACTLPAQVGLRARADVAGTFTWVVDGVGSFEGSEQSLELPAFGTYMVDLTFEAETGCSKVLESIPLEITGFEAHLPRRGPEGCAPFSFSLVDSVASSLPIVSYEWSIGSPPFFTSTDPSPSTTIADTGRYDVRLIVENAYGCKDTIFRPGYIGVGLEPSIDFVAEPLEECLVATRYFTSTTDSYTNGWFWDFGDGNTSTEPNPSHTYGSLGVFDVSLVVSHNGCTNYLNFPEYINVLEPLSLFKINYNCDNPYTVSVQNQSLGADSLAWTIYYDSTRVDTIRDSLLAPLTFPHTGDYVIKHYSINFETMCEHTRADTIRIRDPKASYTADTLQGCRPLEIQISDLSQDANRYKYQVIDGSTAVDTFVNPVLTFDSGGTFSMPDLIITDIHGCMDTFRIEDSVRVNEILPSLHYPIVSCVPTTETLIDSSVSRYGSIVDRMWVINGDTLSTSAAEVEHLFDTTGLYDFAWKVTDSWGCMDSLHGDDLIEGVLVEPDFTADTLSCTGVRVRFRARISDPNIDQYLWDFGDGNTSDKKNVNYAYQTEGTYDICLTVWNRKGCSKTVCKPAFVDIRNPKADFTASPRLGECPPLLSTFQNLSTNATSYVWDFGDDSGLSKVTSPAHVFTTPGQFSVTLLAQLTDRCIDTLTIPNYIELLGPIGSFTYDVDTSCVPLSVSLYAESDDNYTYVWDYGNGQLDSTIMLTQTDTTHYTYTEVGRYIPKLVIRDTAGCSRTFASDPIFVDDLSLDFLLEDSILCYPPVAVDIQNLSSSSRPATYNWRLDGPTSLVAESSSDINLTVDQAGPYTIQLVGSAGLCTDTLATDTLLYVGARPTAAFEPVSDILCHGIDVTFLDQSSSTFGEITDFRWQFGDGKNSTLPSPSHAYRRVDDYNIQLQISTEFGCVDSTELSLSVLPATAVKVSDDATICIGESIQLTATLENPHPDSGYHWENHPSLSCTDCLVPTASPSETTTYYIETTHPSGCTDRDSVTITVIPVPPPTALLSPDTSICLLDSARIDILNYDNSLSYQWGATPGLSCYTDCPNLMAAPSTSQTYYVTVTNSYGCATSSEINISVETEIEDYLIPDRTICEGATTKLGITGGNEPQWRSDLPIDCATCDSIETSPDREGYFYCDVVSDLGCAYSDSVYVHIVPKGSAKAYADSVMCVGEQAELRAEGVGQVQWLPAAHIVDPQAYTTMASPPTSTMYRLEVQADECIQADSTYIKVYEKAEIRLDRDTICPYDVARLNAVGRADDIKWYFEERAIGQGNHLVVEPLQTHTYKAIAQYRTCAADTATTSVVVHPLIEAKVDPIYYTIFSNKAAEVITEYDRDYDYLWSPPTGLSCTDCPNPSIDNVFEKTEYTVCITDPATGCMDEQFITVRYTEACDQEVWGLPNIFSPNGDMSNDGFRTYTSDPEGFVKISIFDRWGEMMFQSEDLTAEWDGTFQGMPAAAGVYPFRLQAVCTLTDETYIIWGDVTLVR